MTGRAAFVVFAAATAATAACSLGALDGFSGGAAAEGAEAGADAGADGASSGIDASGGDASSDGSDGASVTSFCKSLTTVPLLCLDFDDGQVPFGFTKNTSNAKLIIDVQGKDGTKGLTATVPADAPASGTAACISIQLSGPRTALSVEADVRIEKTGKANFDVLNFFAGDDREIGTSITSTTFYIEEERPADGGVEFMTPATAPSNGAFQHLRLALAADGDVGSSELFIDGANVAKHDLLATNLTGSVSFQIGDCNTAGGNDWIVHFDDVVVNEKK